MNIQNTLNNDSSNIELKQVFQNLLQGIETIKKGYGMIYESLKIIISASDALLIKNGETSFPRNEIVSPLEITCKNILNKMNKTQSGKISHSVLLKRMKIDAKQFHKSINTLIERGEIEVLSISTASRPGRFYKRLGNKERTEEGKE